MTTISSTYLLDSSASERQRLLFQGEMFRSDAERLLDRCAIPVGGRAIDVGCGPLGVLDLLAERVGPTGEVVGLDYDGRMLEMARETVVERGIPNVRLVQGDGAGTGELPGSFDVAHTRLVLMNVPHADQVLREMVTLVRPGGYVAVQDVDWLTRVCEPPHPAWDRLVAVIAELWRCNGMDVTIGRKLPGMLRACGVEEVGVDVNTKVFTRGEPYQTLMLDRAEKCREALTSAGLISHAELDRCIDALRVHLDQPGTFVLHATLFQAWGRVAT
jgi:SAM-dependent methyltransferase